MNYQAFTNDSLTMMYEGIRGALVADDEFSRLGGEPRFRVRETPEWKRTPAHLRLKCSAGGCFLTSSIGRKLRESCPLANERRPSQRHGRRERIDECQAAGTQRHPAVEWSQLVRNAGGTECPRSECMSCVDVEG